MKNLPTVSLGLVAVSRSCFPSSLSERRRQALAAACKFPLYECPVIVENEKDVLRALDELKAHGANALCVFLGNFGPETPETLLAEKFDGPVMFAAAAEEGDLHDGRGDAYCGLLNASYNLDLRKLNVHIPEHPVGTAEELAAELEAFLPVARALLGLRGLKIIAFGPRPDDFLACNGPVKPLYDLGVAVEENSELDLLVAYNKHAGDPRIPDLVKEMAAELPGNNPYSGILPRLAQYELTLLDWAEQHKGARQYVAFANKCWPAFQTEFKMVPCYVNGRLCGNHGIPVSCEVDIYGTLSEYLGLCVSGSPVTLLDINNTVPKSIYDRGIAGKAPYRLNETFMGFHCGNTCPALLRKPHMGYQLIMKRDLEPDLPEPDITRGTMEGDLKAGPVTVYRLQATAGCDIRAYVAQGEVLEPSCESFGSIGIIGIPEMDRFYRHVLVGKHFPHHAAIAFGHYGAALWNVFRLLGLASLDFNRPAGDRYPNENPF